MFLRREHPLCQSLLSEVDKVDLNLAKLVFDYTNSGRKFSFIDTLKVKSGWLSVSKLVNSSFEEQEYLLVSAICHDGVEIEAELIDKLMELNVITVEHLKSKFLMK